MVPYYKIGFTFALNQKYAMDFLTTFYAYLDNIGLLQVLDLCSNNLQGNNVVNIVTPI